MSSAASTTAFCRRIAGFAREGWLGAADAVVPTFTNPNNVSIVTGAPPAVHGIAGNYYLDRESGREIMMTDDRLMRSETILGLMSRAGVATAAVTAKDKLRRMLGPRPRRRLFFVGTCRCRGRGAGRARPARHVFGRSVAVRARRRDAPARTRRARLLYLSLSDYVQHGHAPGEPEADAFHRALDERVARFVELGAVVGLIADHGMNDKPRVIFLEDELTGRFGAGAVRVICPITDPFVRHHGALGSFVRVYARDDAISRR